LLGQNVNSYCYEDWSFADLLTAIADISGIERVRFTSPHPKDFPQALLEAVACHPRICSQIHLPVQSGNDRMLDRMGRGYTPTDFRRLVDDIRDRGDIALSTDIICGFCGETENEFLDTYRLIEELEFQSAFIFKYSERKNTIASRQFPDDIPEIVKSDRVTRLVERQRAVSAEINQRLIGQRVEVLVEGDAKKSSTQWMGHTERNVTVVWEKSALEIQSGDLVTINVYDASASTLFGIPVGSLVSAGGGLHGT